MLTFDREKAVRIRCEEAERFPYRQILGPFITVCLNFQDRQTMDIAIYSIKTISDQKINELISSCESFVLENIARTNMSEAIAAIEKKIESKGMKCRVYTKGRSAALVGELAVPLVGWAAAAAMGIHNLATWNPDYEIAKNMITGTLTIEYKK